MSGKLNFILTLIYVAILTWILAGQYVESALVLYFICAITPVVTTLLIYRIIREIPFSHYLLIASFLLIITIPLAGPRETESLEKRTLTPSPEFRASNVWKFLKEYKKYYEDRFAYRNQMIDLVANIKLHVWRISPVPEQVEIGKDNWLYSAGGRYVKLTSTPFDENELKLIATNLEIITQWLGERDIKFYYVCVPIKSRIYPDKMPEVLRRQNAFSRRDQIYTYIRNNKKLNIIDIREELIEGRKTRDTYLKNDTHWNSYGALLAYFKIMKKFSSDFPELFIYNQNMFQLDSVLSSSGDLVNLMGYDSGVPAYQYQLKLKSGPQPLISDSTIPGKFRNYVLVCNNPHSANKLKIFINRDSMTDYMTIPLSSSFIRSYYLWQPRLDIGMIENEKPDILLQEMQELYLTHIFHLPDEIEADSTFMNKHFPDYAITKSKIDFNKIIYF